MSTSNICEDEDNNNNKKKNVEQDAFPRPTVVALRDVRTIKITTTAALKITVRSKHKMLLVCHHVAGE